MPAASRVSRSTSTRSRPYVTRSSSATTAPDSTAPATETIAATPATSPAVTPTSARKRRTTWTKAERDVLFEAYRTHGPVLTPELRVALAEKLGKCDSFTREPSIITSWFSNHKAALRRVAAAAIVLGAATRHFAQHRTQVPALATEASAPESTAESGATLAPATEHAAAPMDTDQVLEPGMQTATPPRSPPGSPVLRATSSIDAAYQASLATGAPAPSLALRLVSPVTEGNDTDNESEVEVDRSLVWVRSDSDRSLSFPMSRAVSQPTLEELTVAEALLDLQEPPIATD
ncbi:hypothetical protein BOTBODRAFT_632082 [Botryobasidium botryosum FD-172 SS1]|uniref:Homeobox domain-containing protein n=1 Tax=Botryobasidium botryosum (strain FD-172 SS1) TaxID=930990 RepID=A0A067N822_BOTB1|nr:hypothetical protein BOTBODRAFT_632082 [Botryobasidium botryosum FD-172 SS1]